MKPIVLYPNAVLRVKTKIIDQIDGQLVTDIDQLTEVLLANENGAGLAAVQLGITRRFFGIKNSTLKKVDLFINPTIVGTYGKRDWIKIKGVAKGGEGKIADEDFLEGCLSFPDLYGMVKRWLKIRAHWEELVAGKLVVHEADLNGFEAIVFQHELDHLDGILFIDHIKRDGGKLFHQIGEKMEEISLKSLKSESSKV